MVVEFKQFYEEHADTGCDTETANISREQFSTMLACLCSIQRCLSLLIIVDHSQEGITGNQIHAQYLSIQGSEPVWQSVPSTLARPLVYLEKAGLIEKTVKSTGNYYQATELGKNVAVPIAIGLCALSNKYQVPLRSIIGATRNILSEHEKQHESSTAIRLAVLETLLSYPHIFHSRLKIAVNSIFHHKDRVSISTHVKELELGGLISRQKAYVNAQQEYSWCGSRENMVDRSSVITITDAVEYLLQNIPFAIDIETLTDYLQAYFPLFENVDAQQVHSVLQNNQNISRTMGSDNPARTKIQLTEKGVAIVTDVLNVQRNSYTVTPQELKEFLAQQEMIYCILELELQSSANVAPDRQLVIDFIRSYAQTAKTAFTATEAYEAYKAVPNAVDISNSTFQDYLADLVDQGRLAQLGKNRSTSYQRTVH